MIVNSKLILFYKTLHHQKNILEEAENLSNLSNMSTIFSSFPDTWDIFAHSAKTSPLSHELSARARI